MSNTPAPLDPDELITVCDQCLMASCWQGIFMCDEARYAGIVEKKRSELEKLHLENPEYWGPHKHHKARAPLPAPQASPLDLEAEVKRLREVEAQQDACLHHFIHRPDFSLSPCTRCGYIQERNEGVEGKPHPAMLALERLTPGGSEYVGDIERCVEYVLERGLKQHHMIVKLMREKKASEGAEGRPAPASPSHGAPASDRGGYPFPPSLTQEQLESIRPATPDPVPSQGAAPDRCSESCGFAPGHYGAHMQGTPYGDPPNEGKAVKWEKPDALHVLWLVWAIRDLLRAFSGGDAPFKLAGPLHAEVLRHLKNFDHLPDPIGSKKIGGSQ